MYEHNALGYWSGLALCLTKVRSSRARCPATALIQIMSEYYQNFWSMSQNRKFWGSVPSGLNKSPYDFHVGLCL